MVQGARPNDMACIGACYSTWANPTCIQWKDINKLVDKDAIKSIWRGISNDNISKGRLKISQCINNDIKENGEEIFLEIMGQSKHHQDCPLWFAEMLYYQFVMQRGVEFSSRSLNIMVGDIKSATIIMIREELGYAL